MNGMKHKVPQLKKIWKRDWDLGMECETPLQIIKMGTSNLMV